MEYRSGRKKKKTSDIGSETMHLTKEQERKLINTERNGKKMLGIT